MDVLTPEQRRLNMSRIRGKDTKPEMMLRAGLHRAGLRFRLHARELPGRPDLIFPRYRAAVLIHGCFWHGHDCALFKLPRTRTEFWSGKIASNQLRDQQTEAALASAGWRVMTVWECAVKGPARQPFSDVIAACDNFIRGSCLQSELQGLWPASVAWPPVDAPR
jgi:DNA mismatch endonuclease (patch repair protein)